MVPKHQSPDPPFQQAFPPAIEIPIDKLGNDDIYIDDSIFDTPDIHNNIE
jgi:hypothetical protein